MSTKSIISQKRNNEVKGVCAVSADIKFSDFTTGVTAIEALGIPKDCYITNIYFMVTEAFDGTSPTVDIGLQDDTDQFLNDYSLSSTVTLNLGGVGQGILTTKAERLVITPTFNSTTTGTIKLLVKYIDTDYKVGMYTEDGK